jgi:transcriptional regulator with XRE-family HTH domain
VASEQPDRRAIFARLLRAARDDAGLSRAKLARQLELSTETLRTWEAGLFLPRDRETTRKLEQVLGTAGELERVAFDELTADRPTPSPVTYVLESSGAAPGTPSRAEEMDEWERRLSSLERAVAVLLRAAESQPQARPAGRPSKSTARR